ncbi:MAG: hypothetical protein ACREQJ_11095 [Candidatus Binatia bacterium]
MLLAILEDALDQLLMTGLAKPQATRSEPERWLVSNDRRSPFSFVNVCETLGLDPRWIRELVVLELASRKRVARSAKRAAGGDPS